MRHGEVLGMLLLEGVGDVLEEDLSQEDVLVLSGVHTTAQRIRRLPKLGFVAYGSAAVACLRDQLS